MIQENGYGDVDIVVGDKILILVTSNISRILEIFLKVPWRNKSRNETVLLHLKFFETLEITRWNTKLKSGYQSVSRIKSELHNIHADQRLKRFEYVEMTHKLWRTSNDSRVSLWNRKKDHSIILLAAKGREHVVRLSVGSFEIHFTDL